MNALILVDLQNDFCAFGALEIAEADQIIPIANSLMDQFDYVVASKDWHPANHGSFAASHPWRKPGQTIDLHGLPQVLWTIHCVQDSFGAELHPKLDVTKIDTIINKGTDPKIDSYSAFFDNGHLKETGLQQLLKDKGVEEVFVMGLATDYCVKFTALDAQQLGFKTHLIVDASRGVDLVEGDVDRALEEMEKVGIELLNSEQWTKTTSVGVKD